MRREAAASSVGSANVEKLHEPSSSLRWPSSVGLVRVRVRVRVSSSSLTLTLALTLTLTLSLSLSLSLTLTSEVQMMSSCAQSGEARILMSPG